MKNIINTKKIMPTALIATIIAASALTLSCIYPTHDDPDFFEEQQSVWQYLNVYSIFRENVPERGANLSPEAMFNAICDTLRGGQYTGYYFPPGTIGPAPVIPPPVVEALTGSTVYFGFKEFDEREIGMFRSRVDYMADFDNIIIDLRNNTGGLINVATEMANQFLPFDTPYIHYRYRWYDANARAGANMEEIVYTTNRNPRLVGKNVMLLVNRYSASASEILASALIDGMNARIIGGLTSEALNAARAGDTNGFIIGERTYGKGRGQRRIDRPGRNMLLITFMEIRGVSENTGDYHRIGLQPDPIPVEYFWEALEILSDDPLSVDPAILEIMETDAELYFALKTLEPSITERINIDDPDDPNDPGSEVGAKRNAGSARQLSRTLGLAKTAESAPPRIIGAYVVDNDELFR